MSEKIRNSIEDFHSYGIYIPRRTVEIFGSIDEEMSAQVIRNLHALDHTPGTINILLNSPGGEVTHGMAIYDALKGCRNHVRAMVFGEAASSASFILMAADERCMAPNAYLMLHVGTDPMGIDLHPEAKAAWDQKFKADGEWMLDVYLTKIKQKKKRYTRNQLKSLIRFDRIMKPKEALELGLIDIIEEHFE